MFWRGWRVQTHQSSVDAPLLRMAARCPAFQPGPPLARTTTPHPRCALQALEPACWAALLKGRKAVLAGDHLQVQIAWPCARIGGWSPVLRGQHVVAAASR